MVVGYRQLGLSALLVGVKEPQVEHAVDHEQAAALFPPAPKPGVLAACGANVGRGERLGVARDAREAKAQLFLEVGLKAIAVAIGDVQVAVVGPGDRPVVAAVAPLGFLVDDRTQAGADDRGRPRSGW